MLAGGVVMAAKLSTRQAEVVALLARGMPDKTIAATLNLDIKTVQVHVQNAAAKFPGKTTPRHRLTLWFFGLYDEVPK